MIQSGNAKQHDDDDVCARCAKTMKAETEMFICSRSSDARRRTRVAVTGSGGNCNEKRRRRVDQKERRELDVEGWKRARLAVIL